MTHHEEERGGEAPTEAPVEPRCKSYHVPDVVAEALSSWEKEEAGLQLECHLEEKITGNFKNY